MVKKLYKQFFSQESLLKTDKQNKYRRKMRISDSNKNIGKAMENRLDKTDKIENFPKNKAVSKKKVKHSGVIIDISTHAKKIKSQNDRILKNAVSTEMETKNIFDIRKKMDGGFYDSSEVVEKIADGIIEELSLMS